MLSPPNVSGSWDFYVCFLTEAADAKPEIGSDVRRLNFQQQGVFVIIENLSAISRPVDTIRLGVWHWTHDEWKLYVADGDDTQITIFQPVNDAITILKATSFESGRDIENPNQQARVASSFGVKILPCV